MMVEARVGENFEAGADPAAFGVVGAIDETRDPRLDDSASAHAARLDGDVKRGVGEPVVAEKAGGFTDGNDFRMSGRVVVADAAVAGTGENLAVMDKDGANGDFAGSGGVACFRECFLHELDVSFHLGRENSMR